VRNGIPFDVAFSVDDVTRAGWSIMFSEMEGAKFDWERLAFEEESP